VGLALHPCGVLAAGVKLCPLRVDPARGLVRAGLQLIQPGGAAVVSKLRFGGPAGNSSACSASATSGLGGRSPVSALAITLRS
jgi:hypothetical protein